MAFENVGVGGHLMFDEKPGLAGMRRAAAGLGQLHSSFAKFGESLEKFNIMGLALGGIGAAGFGEFVHGAFEATSEFEDMNIALGTTLMMTRHAQVAQVATEKGFKDTAEASATLQGAVALAADEMDRIELAAAQAPGEPQDLLNIYKQILGPMSAAGQSLDQIQALTKGAAIATSALGLGFEDMAYGLPKLISGQVRQQDVLYRTLHNQNLIKESAAEWAALPMATRLQKVNALMANYASTSNLVGHTWSALSGTITGIVKMFQRAFIAPIFEKVRAMVIEFTDSIVGSGETLEAFKKTAAAMGAAVVPIFDYVVEVLKGVWNWLKQGWEMAKNAATTIGNFAKELGLTGDAGHGLAVTIGKVITILAVVIPMFSLVGMILGPLIATVELAVGVFTGLATIFFALFSPLGIIIVLIGAIAYGLFQDFRKEGETLGQSLQRLFSDVIVPAWNSFRDAVVTAWTEYIWPFIQGFKEAFGMLISDAIQPLKDAWYDLKESFILVFDTLGGLFGESNTGAREWGWNMASVFAAIIKGISTVIRVFADLVGFIGFVASNIVYAFDVAADAVSTFFFNMAAGITNVFKGVYNAITSPIRGLLNMLADAIEKVGNTSIGKKIFGDLGPGGATKLANDIRMDTIGNGTFAKSQYIDAAQYGATVGESPADRSIRLQRERAEAGLLNKKTEQKAMTFEPTEITLNDERCVKIESKMNIDKSEIAAAQARHQIELAERTGAGSTPWQRRASLTRAQEGVSLKP